MTTYSMGQYRFSSSADTVENLEDITLSYEAVTVSDEIEGSDLNTVSLQDVVISRRSGEPFEAGKDYYAYLQIPQDMNYNLELTLRLTKSSSEEASNFQYIKKISIPSGGSSQNVHQVALYDSNPLKDTDGIIKATIPEDIPFLEGSSYNDKDSLEISKDKLDQNKVEVGMLYRYRNFKENDDGTKSTTETYYYLGMSNENDEKYLKRTDKVNDILLPESWKIINSNNIVTYVVAFRPVDSGFTKLLLKMTRIVEDYNIERVNEEGKTEYGRKLDIKKMAGCKLYKVYDLINNENAIPFNSLTKIGVWGHPELMMIINGEEIKIGPSGYYELDAIPITSLGVVALDNSDMFSIDYQYAID